MVNAIFSYKILDNFWKKRDGYFIKLARLSAEYAGRYYNTVLYCDRNTKSTFDKYGIKFNDYVVSDRLFSNVNAHTYGYSKIAALKLQKDPYIALDLDVLLFEKIISTSTITYGYKEYNPNSNHIIPSRILDLKYLEDYYYKPYLRFKDSIDKHNLELDWRTFPSNSVMLVNNPLLISEIYNEIDNIVDIQDKDSTVQFYEQFLLHNFLKYYKADINFLYEESPGANFNTVPSTLDVSSKKFMHLDFYHKDDNCKELINTLEKKLLKIVA